MVRISFLLLLCTSTARSQNTTAVRPLSFHLIPLGVRGGLDESNLSAYMVAPEGSPNYVCLDAGTLRDGIRKAIDSGAFGGARGAGSGSDTPGVGDILKHSIRAYLISHAHLDHVAGLILNSPDDSSKNIYGLPFCLNTLRDHYFTWKTWANFGDEGEPPMLKRYHYCPLEPGKETPIGNTTLSVKAFLLSHSAPGESTAFLLRNGDAYLLYLGDTGADEIEGSDKLHLLWRTIAPLIRAGQLKAMLIETSFPDEQPDKGLFGHLNPHLLIKELQELDSLAGQGSLKVLPILITHIKPSGNREGDVQEALIRKELAVQNRFGWQFIFPTQGRSLLF